jgi:hypothetical protein
VPASLGSAGWALENWAAAAQGKGDWAAETKISELTAERVQIARTLVEIRMFSPP